MAKARGFVQTYMMVELILPQARYLNSYLEFVKEMLANGDMMWTNMPSEDESAEEFLKRILGQAKPPEGFVPETQYWGVIADEVVGRIAIRHGLNENLREFGGHIGYEVKPSRRRQGVAKEMLKAILALPRAKQIGRLLITCAPNNIGSNKTIIACGGVLEKTAYVAKWNRDTNYYWIDLHSQK